MESILIFHFYIFNLESKYLLFYFIISCYKISDNINKNFYHSWICIGEEKETQENEWNIYSFIPSFI